MLVLLRHGRYLKAEEVKQKGARTEIRIDNSMLALLPNKLVSSVSNDALHWEEPIPRGRVRLKPAPGITITVSRTTSRRITVKKRIYDES
jgi:hypothetical protein